MKNKNLNTSGLIFVENKDGSISLIVEDYDVKALGGRDYETTYTLDKENFEKLRKVLNISAEEPVEPKLIEAFGQYFDMKKFEELCKENEIEYKRFVWIS